MSEEALLASACTAYLEADTCSEAKGRPTDEQEAAATPHHLKKNKRNNQYKGKGDICNSTVSTIQRQYDREFVIHKQKVLANLASNACDHSPKGGVDRDCLPLMQILNEHQDYITTSSCSGRIALFHSVFTPEACGDHAGNDVPAVKRGHKDAQGWLVVKHGPLTEREIDTIVSNLCDSPDRHNIHSNTKEEYSDGARTTTGDVGGAKTELDGVWVQNGLLSSPAPHLPTFGTLALKMEPFVMHVACRTMASAKLLLSAAVSDGGFRNSGVTPPGKRVLCAIRHAAGLGLDVPLIVDGVNYAAGQHAYVRRLLLLVNTKMQVNGVRLRKLEEGVATRLGVKASDQADS